MKNLLRPDLAELTSYAPADPPGITVRLDANEAPRNPSPAIREAVLRSVAGVALERYPDPRALALKSRISERTGARVEDLIVGTGSDELIALLATALARPREKAPQAVVLVPTPTFVMYRVTARAHGLKPVDVPLDARWDLDVASMKRAIELMDPNLIFIASPNNPTGNRMTESRLAEIVDAAPRAFVVIDEAYVDYAGASLRSWIAGGGGGAAHPNVGILRTLSKLGLAALRVGWLEADAEIVGEIDKVRQPYNVSATTQAAAASVMADGDAWNDVRSHVAMVVAERSRLNRELVAMKGFEVTPSDANFLWVKTPRPANEVYDALARLGILVRSFHAAGGRLSHQLRMTVGSSGDNDRLLEALRTCV